MLLFAIWVLSPVVADLIVERIVEADTNDVRAWHTIAHDTLLNFTNIYIIASLATQVAVIAGAIRLARYKNLAVQNKLKPSESTAEDGP
jgi:hypothetical protein